MQESVGEHGVEPWTSVLSGLRSSQLSYSPKEKISGTRHAHSDVLYHAYFKKRYLPKLCYFSYNGYVKRHFRSPGLTLIELLVVVAILAILAVVVYSLIDPAEQKKRVNYAHAKTGVAEIGRAVQIYEANNSGLPDDVSRNIMPDGLAPHIRGGVWPAGPFEGSVYDYDNWKDEECWDGSTGNVQITLRQVPGYNPDGTNNWAIYYVLEGTGVPHCREPLFKGECVNCHSYTMYPN